MSPKIIIAFLVVVLAALCVEQNEAFHSRARSRRRIPTCRALCARKCVDITHGISPHHCHTSCRKNCGRKRRQTSAEDPDEKMVPTFDDRDGDGYIQFDELGDVVDMMPETAREVFDLLDVNNDGVLDKDEVIAALLSIPDE